MTQQQMMIKEIEGLRRDESMKGVSTATEINIKDHNHTYNQALRDVINKFKQLTN